MLIALLEQHAVQYSILILEMQDLCGEEEMLLEREREKKRSTRLLASLLLFFVLCWKLDACRRIVLNGTPSLILSPLVFSPTGLLNSQAQRFCEINCDTSLTLWHSSDDVSHYMFKAEFGTLVSSRVPSGPPCPTRHFPPRLLCRYMFWT